MEGTEFTMGDGRRIRVERCAGDGRGPARAAALTDELKVEACARVEVRRAGGSECIRIRTRLGHTSEVGRGCRLVGFGEGGPAQVRAGDLRAGNWLAAPRRVRIFGGASLPEGHALFLALMASDGNLWSEGHASFNNTDPGMVAAFVESVRGIEGVEVTSWADGESYGIKRDARARAAREKNAGLLLLDRHGLLGKFARERSVPDAVFALPRGELAAYLGALWSGDGSAYRHRTSRGETSMVLYWSASRRMAEDVQHLLLRFGVVARFKKVEAPGKESGRTGTHYWLHVTEAENIRAFASSVGRHAIGWEAEKLHRAVGLLPETGRPTLDVVPAEVWDTIERAREARGLSRRAVDTGAGVATRKRKNMSRRKLLAVAELLGDGDLLDIAESDLIWDRVEGVERIGQRATWEVSWERAHGGPPPLGLLAGHGFLAGGG